MAVIVTVGRNVREHPMSTRDWNSFREEVESVVRQHTDMVYFVGTGEGDSENWGQEDAFTIVAGDINLGLHDALSKVGRYYGQEAVAVTQGETYFI